PEVVIFDFVNVDSGEIAVAAGGDIEAEAIFGFGFEEFAEVIVDEVFDVGTAAELVFGVELAELFLDLVVFKVGGGCHSRSGSVRWRTIRRWKRRRGGGCTCRLAGRFARGRSGRGSRRGIDRG